MLQYEKQGSHLHRTNLKFSSRRPRTAETAAWAALAVSAQRHLRAARRTLSIQPMRGDQAASVNRSAMAASCEKAAGRRPRAALLQ